MASDLVIDRGFEEIVDAAVRRLVLVDHRRGWTLIQTPLLYPNGATVPVRIEMRGNSFAISDMAQGYLEAEAINASLVYSRFAQVAAEAAGLSYELHALTITGVAPDNLDGAIMTVANLSLEAVTVAAHRIIERTEADISEVLYERLVRIFSAPKVKKDATIIGASNTKWKVASVVEDSKRPIIFEPVSSHHSSVAHANMKFQDIGLLEQPPRRIAMVRSKKDLGTYLGVLAQSADVIEETVSNDAMKRLAGPTVTS